MALTQTAGPAPSKLRADIQALRGLAVLVVVLFHAKVARLAAGYLGVDIFFVISGFLMTSQIRDGLTRGTFTLGNFYLRRAKRLLPAAYLVFLLTTLAAPFFLGRLEMHDFVQQLIGAVTFSSNIVLWRQSGYFDGLAELKPLLHTWSLALEEQYYLLLPAAMMLVPRRRWTLFAFATCAASLALVGIFAASQVASFYLLPTRAWELMIGSIAALLPLTDVVRALLRRLFWPSLAALFAMPLFAWRHGGVDLGAMVVCVATFTVILTQHPALNSGLAVRAMGKLGDISYSLYLVHWPLLAFFSNAWFGEDEAVGVRLLLALASVGLAVALHRWVEKPTQHRPIANKPRFWALVAAGPVLLVSLAVGLAHASAPVKDYEQLRRPNVGLSEKCEFGPQFTPIAACRTSDQPKVLVWGDSHAMHLMPGLAAEFQPPLALVQATRSTCAPLLDMAAVSDDYPLAAATDCIRFNASVADYLKRTPSIEVVVLVSTLGHYVDPGWRNVLQAPDGQLTQRDAAIPAVVAGFERTARFVRGLGKRVVVAASPPQQLRDTGRCLERQELHLPLFGTPDCALDVAGYHALRQRVLELLAELPARAGLDVVSMDPFLCDAARCKTQLDGQPLYRDAGHLSYAGSVLLAQKMHLGQLLLDRAR